MVKKCYKSMLKKENCHRDRLKRMLGAQLWSDVQKREENIGDWAEKIEESTLMPGNVLKGKI